MYLRSLQYVGILNLHLTTPRPGCVAAEDGGNQFHPFWPRSLPSRELTLLSKRCLMLLLSDPLKNVVAQVVSAEATIDGIVSDQSDTHCVFPQFGYV